MLEGVSFETPPTIRTSIDDSSAERAPRGSATTPEYRHQTSLIRWLAALLLIVASALIWTLLQQPGPRAATSSHHGDTALTTPEPRAVTARGNLADDETATIELFRSVSPSVVHITNLQAQRDNFSLNVLEIPRGTGSGFAWDEDGHIVTNNHVIQNADRVAVTLSDNTVWPGTIVGTAPENDLAVVRINAPPEKLTPISVGASVNLQVGQKVFAIGNPFGLDQTLTTGVISGLNREIKSATERPLYDVIQTDAAINPGNSGGPLLDSAGLLIGVNTAIFSPSGAYAGIGFAVPADTVNRVVPQLIANGRVVKPGLGIIALDGRSARRLGIEGVVVRTVQPNSAADKAGLLGMVIDSLGRQMPRDIIRGIDDTPLRTIDDLYRVLDNKRVGDEVTLLVQRGSEQVPITLTLQDLQ
ncbi:MAG: trypsin-like peptidase domain-containing protein [Haliangiales bacterium]